MSDWTLTQGYDFEGRRVAYDLAGQGPPLVLVHGTPWSSFSWRHLIPRLAQGWRVHYYDLLGYGQSAKGDFDVSLGVQNRVLAGLIAHWGLEAPLVVGHDFGGATVLRAHLLDGVPFRRMVLVDAVALSPWGSPFFRHVREHQAAFAGVPAYIHKAIVEAYVQGAAHRPMPPATLAGIVAPWLGEAGQAGFYRQIAQADSAYTDQVEPRYGEIAVPVLVAWGEEDPWIPLATGERLHQAIPGARWVPVPGAGHLVQEEAPDRLAQVISDFLGEAD